MKLRTCSWGGFGVRMQFNGEESLCMFLPFAHPNTHTHTHTNTQAFSQPLSTRANNASP